MARPGACQSSEPTIAGGPPTWIAAGTGMSCLKLARTRMSGAERLADLTSRQPPGVLRRPAGPSSGEAHRELRTIRPFCACPRVSGWLDRTGIRHPDGDSASICQGVSVQVARGRRLQPNPICPVCQVDNELAAHVSRICAARNATNQLIMLTKSVKSRRLTRSWAYERRIVATECAICRDHQRHAERQSGDSCTAPRNVQR